VFSRGAMDAFLIKNILPKLATAVKNWNINPSQQQLGKLFYKFPYDREPFLWVVCDEHSISSLFFFFIIQFADVWHWVMNWKDLMPIQSIIQMLV